MAKRLASTSGLPGTGQPPAPRVRRTKAQIKADAEARQVEPPSSDEPTQNGITRPKVGTVTRRIWDIADEISRATGAPAERAAVVQQALNEQLQAGTATTHFLNWAQFWGLKGVQPATPPPVFAPPPPVQAPLDFAAQAAAFQPVAPQAPVYYEQPVAFQQPPVEVLLEPRPVPDKAAAWESGYSAYQDGYRRDRNPFARSSFQCEAWYAGWDAAKGDDRNAEADA